jgi:REP element-mobilizing transposase RayT
MLRLYCRRFDQCLDVGIRECRLQEPAVTSLVAGSLRRFDRERYDLFAWAVMPNHIHVLFRPLVPHSLSKILHSWKSYTGTQANKILERRRTFWEREYFDHLVRSGEDLVRFARYFRENPRKSGLPGWPWVWVCEEVLRPVGGV